MKINHMEIVQLKKDEKAKWDQFVSGHPQGHLFQSFDWGALKARAGWTSIRLVVRVQNEIRAAIQILKRPIPLTGKCIFYAPRGPVLDYEDREIFDFLMDHVKEIAQKHRAVFILIDPDISDENEAIKAYLIGRGFMFSDQYGVVGLTQPKRVFRLDLGPSEDELLANMGPNHRRNIRMATKKGVTIEETSSLEGLKAFYKLFNATSQRKNFYIRSLKYQKNLLDFFQKDNNIVVFLARHEGRVVAGRLILLYGDKSWDMYAASDTKVSKLNASYLLVWEIIKAMKKRGCIMFDFRGADSKDPQSPLYGVHMFKKGFGPEYIEFIGEYYLVLLPFYFNCLNRVKALLKRAIRMCKMASRLNPLAIKKNFSIHKSEAALKESVLEKYAQPEEVDAHSGILKLGLLDAEKRLVNEYFTSGSRLLNIGCGAGREALALMGMGFDVTGTDLQPRMVERAIQNAKDNHLEPKFCVMDACALKFPDDSFENAVMVGSIITHIPKKANRIQALREAKRVLKPGGHVLISTPNCESHIKYKLYFSLINPWRRFCKMVFKSYPLEEGDRFGVRVSDGKSKGKVYFHMYAMNELAGDIKNAGLRIVKCRSNRELTTGVDAPGDRTKDYFLYFVAQKLTIKK